MAVICATCGKAVPCPENHPGGGVDISGTQLNWLNSPYLKISPDECLALMNEMIGMEVASTDMQGDEQYHGYRPYPIGKLGYLLDKILGESEAHHPGIVPPVLRFLEIGCGPGTKVYFALKAFSLDAYGFDIDPQWMHDSYEFLKARGVGSDALDQPRTWCEDAEDFEDAADYDIVFLNRPLKDNDREVQLEEHIAASMKDDSYLILGNALTVPPGWKFISQDVVARAYKKVCRCDGLEEVIYNNGADVPITCRICERTIVD